jgi:hypothetical protein
MSSETMEKTNAKSGSSRDSKAKRAVLFVLRLPFIFLLAVVAIEEGEMTASIANFGKNLLMVLPIVVLVDFFFDGIWEVVAIFLVRGKKGKDGKRHLRFLYAQIAVFFVLAGVLFQIFYGFGSLLTAFSS